MVNIVKFAQFYCIYLLSSAQMSAGEKQIRCFYKKTIYSMVVLPSGIGTLYTVRIFGGLQAAGMSRIISCFFEIISAKYRYHPNPGVRISGTPLLFHHRTSRHLALRSEGTCQIRMSGQRCQKIGRAHV